MRLFDFFKKKPQKRTQAEEEAPKPAPSVAGSVKTIILNARVGNGEYKKIEELYIPYESYSDYLERFAKLPIPQQLKILCNNTQRNDVIIGCLDLMKIPENVSAEGYKENFQKLIGNAQLLWEHRFMDRDHDGYNWLFSVDNLLIGMTCLREKRMDGYTGYGHFDICRVYRFNKNETVQDQNLDRIWYTMFGWLPGEKQ